MRRKVLILDDFDIIRTLIAGMLRDTGYEVFQAATSEQAHAILAENDILVVLCDFSLGGGTNGADFLRGAVRQHPDLKCILMSGSFAPGNAPKAPFPLISKPFETREIVALIDRLLSGDPADRD